MSTLTAVVQSTQPPRVQLTATGVTVKAGTLTMWRIVDGEREPVRGMVDVPTDRTTYVAVDLEAPFGVPVTYQLVATYNDGTSDTATAAPVTLTTALPWISNPITGEGVTLTIADWPELSYAARQTVVDVGGRAAPIVVSDVRAAAASDLTVLTLTQDTLKALRRVLATGDVLQVRAVCGAVEGGFYAFGDVTETRVKPRSGLTDQIKAGTDWRRLVKAAVQEVDRPAVRIPAVGDTLADLNAYVPTTLADMATAFGPGATLLTIAQTPLKAG